MTSGARMGQVVEGARGPDDFTFGAAWHDAGCTVRLIEDGEIAGQGTGGTPGSSTTTLPVNPTGGGVMRAEVWTADGATALFTNSVHFVDEARGGRGAGGEGDGRRETGHKARETKHEK